MRMQLARIGLAIVAMAASVGAHAQSHLTLYGILDVGYLYTNPSTGASTSDLADGIQSQSRFGLRGVERVTSDLNAIFTLEGGISPDTGQSQQAGRLFGRQAWAGLLTGVIEARLGRQYGVGYEYFLADTSPFGTTFRDAGTGNVFSSASGRLILDNVVMLRTADFGGLSGAIGYSFNASGAEAPGSDGNVGTWTAGARYRGRNLYLAVSYERFNCASTASGTGFNTCNASAHDDQSHLQVGGSYAFSIARVYGMWALEQNQFAFFAVTPAKKAQVWELGIRLKAVGGELLAAYQGRDDDFHADLGVWGVGFTVPLSRGTNVYTFVSDTKADDTPTAQAATCCAIVREGYTPAQVAAYRDRDRLQFAVGVRHIF
jgi:predicted porin